MRVLFLLKICYTEIGIALSGMGNYNEVLDYHKKALEIRKRLDVDGVR